MCLVVIIQLEAWWPKALHNFAITKAFLYYHCYRFHDFLFSVFSSGSESADSDMTLFFLSRKIDVQECQIHITYLTCLNTDLYAYTWEMRIWNVLKDLWFLH